MLGFASIDVLQEQQQPKEKNEYCICRSWAYRGQVLVLNEHGFVPRNWADIEVGDVVKVMHDEFAPADIVVLSTSGDGGNFYVETSNLDGETNLKVRVSWWC